MHIYIYIHIHDIEYIYIFLYIRIFLFIYIHLHPAFQIASARHICGPPSVAAPIARHQVHPWDGLKQTGKDAYLEDHPRTCKWLVTMVGKSPK